MTAPTVDIDGTTVPLHQCTWVLWYPCGCARAVTTAAYSNTELATEDQAWAEITPNEEERARERRAGQHIELMAHTRYRKEVSPTFGNPCPHQRPPEETLDAVRTLHAPEVYYHPADPYENLTRGDWPLCDHCDEPVISSPFGALTEGHFTDEHGILRCRTRPRRRCAHCLTNHGEEAFWPCPTRLIVDPHLEENPGE